MTRTLLASAQVKTKAHTLKRKASKEMRVIKVEMKN